MSRKLAFGIRLLCFAFLIALAAHPSYAAQQGQRPLPVLRVQDFLPCRSYFDWTLDPGGKADIREIAAPERDAQFTPLNGGLPLRASGTLWLRLTLGPRPPEQRPATLLLDMGDGLPGTPLLFAPRQNPFTEAREWQDFQPSRQSVFLLPETQTAPLTVYVRLEGTPGLWFEPVLRTPHNAAAASERLVRPAVLTALGAAALLCLLRALSERGQWRIWTSLYTAAAFIQAYWGMPAAPEGSVLLRDLPGVLAPGIALMLLPHVGRHLMRTRTAAPALDLQFLLLSLPGAALALLPLAPGMAWTCRYVALWPAVMLLFIPTALGAWLYGLPGARRFLLACLAPLAGVVAGTAGLFFGPSALLASCPMLGVALGALCIAGTAAPREYEREERTAPARGLPEPGLSPDISPELSVDVGDPVPRPAAEAEEEEPGLRLLSPAELEAETGSAPVEAVPAPAVPPADGGSDGNVRAARLRPLLANLLRESSGLAQCALPPAARQHIEAVQAAGRGIAALLDEAQTPRRVPVPVVFDLQQLLRDLHAGAAAEAERRGLSFSWFMPPHLSHYYFGDAEGLAEVLRLLLESSIRASKKGFVQLAVRRMPESVEPGHLLFSVSDTGSGMPPRGRGSTALLRAWEFAGAHGGGVSVESDGRGAVISFTLHLEPHGATIRTEPHQTARPARVLIVDELAGSRRLLSFFLEDLPCDIQEARNSEEAARLHAEKPFDLLLLDCDMPEAENIEALAGLRARERAEERRPVPLLALESEESRWEGLQALGEIHLLTKPIARGPLRETVLRLLRAEEPAEAPQAALPDEALRPVGAGAPEEAPLDLPPPVAYGPGRQPEARDAFVPLSLDVRLDLPLGPPAAPPQPASRRAAEPAALSLTAPETPSALPVAEEPPVPVAEPAIFLPEPEMQPAPPSSPPPAMEPVSQALYPPEKFSEFPTTLDRMPADFLHHAEPVDGSQCLSPPAALMRTPLLQPFESRASEPPEAEENISPPARNFENPRRAGLLDWVNGARTARSAPGAQRAAPMFSAPPAAPTGGAGGYDMEEWVGEPTPIPRRPVPEHAAHPVPRPVPRPVPARGYAHMPEVPDSHGYGAPPDALEWVGEPTPVPRGAASARPAPQAETPRGYIRPPLVQPSPGYGVPVDSLEWVGEPMPVAGQPSPRPEISRGHVRPVVPSGHVAVPDSLEWVGEPRPVPGRSGRAAPPRSEPEARGEFVPLRLTDTPSPSSGNGFTPLRLTDAPPPPPAPEPETLFPDDRSVLGFVLDEPGARAGGRGKFSPPLPRDRGEEPRPVHAPRGPEPVVPAPARGPQPPLPELVLPEPVARGAAPAPRPPGASPASVAEQMGPLIPGLIAALDEAMDDVRRGFSKADTVVVEEAAARIASRADNYGLRILARMARCVEMAAKARDKDALANILPDLETAVERNRIALMPKR